MEFLQFQVNLIFVFCVSVKVKLSVYCKILIYRSIIVFVCIPPGKAVPKMTFTVSGGTLNPTHSFTHLNSHSIASVVGNISAKKCCESTIFLPNLLPSKRVLHLEAAHPEYLCSANIFR